MYVLSAHALMSVLQWLFSCWGAAECVCARSEGAAVEQMGEQWAACTEKLLRNHLMLRFPAREFLCLTLKGNKCVTAGKRDAA